MISKPKDGSGNQRQAPTADVRLEMKLKNNLLYQAITAKFGSIHQFCVDAKKRGFSIQESVVGNLINFKISPFTKRNPSEYRKICLTIERALGMLAEDLFPAELYRKIKMSSDVITFNSENLPALSAHKTRLLVDTSAETHPEMRIMDAELIANLQQTLKTLTYREREVVMLYYGIGGYEEHTLDVIAAKFHVDKDRVKKVLAKAITKLKHPVRAEKLAKAIPLSVLALPSYYDPDQKYRRAPRVVDTTHTVRRKCKPLQPPKE